jgi:mannose-6-phosphate isomerase-like protein (cupin superfamily)
MTVIKTNDVAPIDRGGGVTTIPLITAQTYPGAAVTTGISLYPRGTGAPLHSHNCDEQVTVLQGDGEVEIDGVVTHLQPFDSTYIRAGQSHAFRNAAEEPLRILWIYPTQHVTRTLAATGITVQHLSAEDMMGPTDQVGAGSR